MIQSPKAVDLSTDVIDEREKLVKVMEYVEQAGSVTSADRKARSCSYYLVLETEKGNRIVTERKHGGKLSWVFNPADLDDRTSLAKLTRSEACNSGVNIRNMMNYRAKLTEGSTLSAKRFAQAMFACALGRSPGAQP